MVKGGMCGKGSMHGEGDMCTEGGACVVWGHAWQERQPLQQMVHILLECILVYEKYNDVQYSNQRTTVVYIFMANG